MLSRRAGRAAATGSITGRARIGHRTKDLSKRLAPGEIAVIHHVDLDRVAADGLLEAGAAAVVNAATSISGRYPNGGPVRLVRAGVPLVDDIGAELLDLLVDGELVTIDGGRVLVGDRVVAEGRPRALEDIEHDMHAARSEIGHELERFAVNTLEYVREEASITFDQIVLPPLRTSFDRRHALVVVRGHDYREDLRALRHYIREYRPVLIGVDGGADALLEIGLRPDIIIGDFDSVSERALAVGAELVHHVHPDGRAPGREQLQGWGLPYEEFVVEGTSEDVAMLLAYEAGATLIVAVGTHATMVEFLDKGRRGMSSTFLTRLRLGPMLVDAKGVSRLYEGRVHKGDLAILIVAALVAMLVITVASEPLRVFLEALWLTVRDLWNSVTGRFG